MAGGTSRSMKWISSTRVACPYLAYAPRAYLVAPCMVEKYSSLPSTQFEVCPLSKCSWRSITDETKPVNMVLVSAMSSPRTRNSGSPSLVSPMV